MGRIQSEDRAVAHRVLAATKEEAMAMVVDCECGQQIRADSEEDLVSKVYEHIDGNHPDLVGKLSREDVVAMAHDE
jgi:predicted small metal-binding protein